MTRAEASAILEASFGRPTSTPSYEHERPSFLEQQRDRLRACQIEPVKIIAVASRWSQEHLGLDGDAHDFVAIATSEGEWLLYSERAGKPLAMRTPHRWSCSAIHPMMRCVSGTVKEAVGSPKNDSLGLVESITGTP